MKSIDQSELERARITALPPKPPHNPTFPTPLFPYLIGRFLAGLLAQFAHIQHVAGADDHAGILQQVRQHVAFVVLLFFLLLPIEAWIFYANGTGRDAS